MDANTWKLYCITYTWYILPINICSSTHLYRLPPGWPRCWPTPMWNWRGTESLWTQIQNSGACAAKDLQKGECCLFLREALKNCFYRTRVRSLGMLVSNWVTHSLTHCCLVNLIDVTLAFEDANSKLVEVDTVACVNAEDHVGNSLLQIWELTFGPKAKLLFRLWAQGLLKI